MQELLQIEFEGWTATPRMPMILSGNAICLNNPTYSTILGIIGCCMGRLVEGNELAVGFKYSFDNTGTDLETRHRLEFDGKKIKKNAKGTDAYTREFHLMPKLTIWINRLDWIGFFLNPVGTPCLGQSQDLLRITKVDIVDVAKVNSGKIGGTLIPFNLNTKLAGQLIQVADYYIENDVVGMGRRPNNTKMYLSLNADNFQNIENDNLYKIYGAEEERCIYLNEFS
jgi:CRISPR-associated protein Cas5t